MTCSLSRLYYNGSSFSALLLYISGKYLTPLDSKHMNVFHHNDYLGLRVFHFHFNRSDRCNLTPENS